MKFFQRISAEKVPGTEKTYFVEMLSLQEETRKAFKATLSKEQFRAFEVLGIQNPMEDIKIPNDPIGLYIEQRLIDSGVIPGQ